MAEQKANSTMSAASSACFKEAVCIDAGRVYDSCSDRRLPSLTTGRGPAGATPPAFWSAEPLPALKPT